MSSLDMGHGVRRYQISRGDHAITLTGSAWGADGLKTSPVIVKARVPVSM